jgi:hypothetical protein
MSKRLRETPGYVVTRAAKGVRITAKEKDVDDRTKVVSFDTWDALKGMSDQSFDGSCLMELGIGAFRRQS